MSRASRGQGNYSLGLIHYALSRGFPPPCPGVPGIIQLSSCPVERGTLPCRWRGWTKLHFNRYVEELTFPTKQLIANQRPTCEGW